MTWMIIKLILSLAFVAGILLVAARVAKKRGLGGGANAVIEVVARQRMGRSSSIAVLRIADRVLVVGSTEQTITLLGEVDSEAVEELLSPADDLDRELPEDEDPGSARPVRGHRALPAPRQAGGMTAGSVLDRAAWTSLVAEVRERTVRR